ncbi:MAG: hypothetical protein ACRDH9_12490 [Actinomycetota bacterium]
MKASERGWVRGAVVIGIAGTMMAVALLSPALAVRLATTSYVKQKVNQAFNQTFGLFLQQPIITTRSDPIAVPPGGFSLASIACPAGGVATGGGASSNSPLTENWEMEDTYPSNGATPGAGSTGWTVGMENIAGGTTFRVYVVCGGGSGFGNFTPGSTAKTTDAEWAPDVSKPEVNFTVVTR